MSHSRDQFRCDTATADYFFRPKNLIRATNER